LIEIHAMENAAALYPLLYASSYSMTIISHPQYDEQSPHRFAHFWLYAARDDLGQR
jgi:hypothetical protein